MDWTHDIRISVRTYELDAMGHVNQAVYHSYDEHVRSELLRTAGCSLDRLLGDGMAPVLLESHTVFKRELRSVDEVELNCTLTFGTGKTFRSATTITRADGELAARIDCTVGLLDLGTRRLLPDPEGRLTRLVTAAPAR